MKMNGNRFFSARLAAAAIILIATCLSGPAPAQEGVPPSAGAFPPPLPAPPAAAGAPGAEGEILPAPACFNVVNKAPYSVYGSINTSYYTEKDGSKARHHENFRLKTGEGAQVCTSGPFYAGRKVELVVRTLVPVFSCKTGIAGDVVIYGKKKAEGGTETWAGCL